MGDLQCDADLPRRVYSGSVSYFKWPWFKILQCILDGNLREIRDWIFPQILHSPFTAIPQHFEYSIQQYGEVNLKFKPCWRQKMHLIPLLETMSAGSNTIQMIKLKLKLLIWNNSCTRWALQRGRWSIRADLPSPLQQLTAVGNLATLSSHQPALWATTL